MYEGTSLFRSPACQTILCDIRHYIEDADRIFKRKERFDQDRRDFYARAMVLFVISNRLIDLAREVSLVRGYITSEEPVKNKVLFKRLNDHGIISWEMRQQMIALVNYRNRISHHFYEITRDDLDEIYLMVPVWSDFMATMEAELIRSDREKKRTVILAGAAVLAVILLLLWYFS